MPLYVLPNRHDYVLNTADAAATITPGPGVVNYVFRHNAVLTADRTLTLDTAGRVAGDTIMVNRIGAGAFNLSVGGLKNLTQNTWCIVVFNGSNFSLIAYGAL